MRLGGLCLALFVALRIAPDFGLPVPEPLHSLASRGWAGAFLLWLWMFWPFLSRIGAPPEAAEGSVGKTSAPLPATEKLSETGRVAGAE